MPTKNSKITRLVPQTASSKNIPPNKVDSFFDEAMKNITLPKEPKSIPYKLKKTFARLKHDIREAKFSAFAVAEFHSQNNNTEQMLRDKLPELEQQYERALHHFEQLKRAAEKANTIDIIPSKSTRN